MDKKRKQFVPKFKETTRSRVLPKKGTSPNYEEGSQSVSFRWVTPRSSKAWG